MNNDGWLALVAFLGAFIVAQGWKFVDGLIHGQAGSVMKNFKVAVEYLMRSGGMPSAHSADMTALTTFLGCRYGLDSGLFALAVASTAVVLYDAIHVRFAVGLQGRALNQLLEKNGKKPLPVVEGHTPAQVAVGVILGVLVGLLVYFCWGRTGI